jgi:hypothetical protein
MVHYQLSILRNAPISQAPKEKMNTDTAEVSPSESDTQITTTHTSTGSMSVLKYKTNMLLGSVSPTINITTTLTEANKRRRVDEQEQPPDFDNSPVTVIPGSLDIKVRVYNTNLTQLGFCTSERIHAIQRYTIENELRRYCGRYRYCIKIEGTNVRMEIWRT